MKHLLFAASLLGSLSLVAGPSVLSVDLSQNRSTRLVTLKYTVTGEPAIVTVDIRTNGVSIGAANYRSMSGAVNTLVQPDVEQTAFWAADKDWPGYVFDTPCVTAVVTAWATNSPPDYFVQNLADWSDRAWYVSADAIPGGLSDDIYRTQKLVMRRIPAAMVEWSMGSPSTELGRAKANEVQRRVVLSKDYYMAVFETTGRQWELVMGGLWQSNKFKGPEWQATRPVSNLSYSDLRGGASDWPKSSAVIAGSFFDALRNQSGLSGFDLPTEAQWEYACRAGCNAALYTGCEITSTDGSCPNVDRISRYQKNGGYDKSTGAKPTDEVCKVCSTDIGTDRVGNHEPNAWGLYDMIGNVQEWCRDQVEKDGSWSETGTVVTDPVGGSGLSARVLRGGGCYSLPKDCRAAYRYINETKNGTGATLGFRICLEF